MEVDYKKLSDQVFKEINNARQNPKSLVDDLLKMKKYFKGKEYRNPKLNYLLKTEEGADAIDEAIEFLANKSFIKDPLIRDDMLDKAANELVEHIGPSGYTQAQEASMMMDKRVKKFLSEQGAISENVSFGWGDARDIVLQMIIDDGVKSRGHRKNLFGSNFRKVGIASGKHKTYQHCTVMEFFGAGGKSNLSFEKYQIDKEEWPDNAVSLQKHIESKTVNDETKIVLTYTFTLADGGTVKKTKEFIEKQ